MTYGELKHTTILTRDVKVMYF